MDAVGAYSGALCRVEYMGAAHYDEAAYELHATLRYGGNIFDSVFRWCCMLLTHHSPPGEGE